MERMLITPWSIALSLSVIIHAGLWYSVSLQNSDMSIGEQIQTLEVSLLPSLPPQKKITLPPKQIRTPAVTRTKPVVTSPVIAPSPTPEPETESATMETDTQPASSIQPELQAPRFNAAYLNNPPPVYPLAARRRNIEGQVWVRAEVHADGSCGQVELKTPSASEILNQAALEAVKKWRFVPAMLGDQTLTAWVEIPITFKLNN